ncbi:bifunctional diaminohydroxyphosphoribosylaminopyrimidine deaminase/5-amino-6-(5-phosphoribosylamino)uracil reductase RibD [Rhabdothermincola sediminis]|uniref:bifunctional diaminohydroxyphosphoribosylaminopyrimidine deaminase/5-amino-6-(5-phosphoribosylamino)uracil reductase RibD n=1 Tax=Rhabdothermincola sediminis TaxID=2751370 RepID=UPI0027DA4353|nr:bifunctional diaminohydroxyphosphoribosylaminopyrimidine deaminase/5-amino-6-(5-phosphoribosylamino)uracil reductase RibD [Rhabdothermincola sediminis]
MTDEERMRQAFDAAAGVRRRVAPRPWVGAVVVPADDPDGPGIVGATDGREGPHAEIVALRAAGSAAKGATLFCTLEPCSHHGRTPPCADAVIAAGISRVVVAIEDPDPHVSGRGLARLADAGIEVQVGVGEAFVREQLRPYLHHRRTGRPFVILKLAATIDGRTAAPDGSSQWITGPTAREDAHRLRADSDAVLVGAGTVRADDPSLTVRLPAGEADGVEPLRVVLGRAPAGAKVHPALELGGDLDAVLAELGARGVLQLLVEGGAQVAHQFHTAGLVDRYVFYLAPALMGGDDAPGLFSGPAAASIEYLWRGDIVNLCRLGDDLRIDLEPRRGSAEGTIGQVGGC